eukprot:scaffold14739_cov116-Skeletonema_marinoi.AAC.1
MIMKQCFVFTYTYFARVGVGVCADTVAVTLLLDLRSCFRLNFLQAYYDHDTVRSQYRTSPSPSQSQKKDRSKEEMAMDVFAWADDQQERRCREFYRRGSHDEL